MSRQNSLTPSRYRPCLIGTLLALGVTFFSMPMASAQVPHLPGWDLSWNDEFDGNSLDTQKWEALDRRDSFNDEKQYYHPDQVAVADGALQITAIDTPREGKAYQSGLVTSRDLFGVGRFEARIDLPTSQGMWPAFWLNSNHVPWPQGGEIDILENRGSQPTLVSSAYHWQTNPGPCCDDHRYTFHEHTATEGGQPVDFHAGYHTYAAEWDETTIRYYVDDVLHLTVEERPNRPIFETTKNLILNVAVGGFFGGDPDATTVWPQTMLVDYVRVWQQSTDPDYGVNLLINPGFDDNGGSLDGWDVFGNTIGNVTASDSLVNDGTHALKVFGQFTGGPNTSGVSQGVAITEGVLVRAGTSSQTPSWDTLFGKDNEVTMRIEFFSSFGAASGSNDFLGEVSQLIHDGSSAQNAWLDHTLEAIAPDGAVEARLSFLFDQTDNDNGAIWIDSASLVLEEVLAGDYNFDGVVDAADYAVWRDGDAHVEGQAGYDLWAANYGATASVSSAAVPEPASIVVLMAASFMVGCSRRLA
ncbi:Glucan endo-1,3-beta-glucosidase A1 precursor [Planctomycetes bacterium MalM25]|nr:Glucan endo-1,3-beta-glucosidase A1 precursor [Planctomycetes bacterium MalM25]